MSREACVKGTGVLIVFALAVCLVLASAGCSTREAAEKAPFVLGAIMPLTGESAYAGQLAKVAMEMAVEEVNKEGGIQGHPIRLIVENDNFETGKSQAAANKLITTDQCHLLNGPFHSSGIYAVQKLTEEMKVPHIVVCGSARKLTMEGQQMFFRLTLSDLYQTGPMVKYAVEKAGCKRIALLCETGSHGEGTLNGWIQDLKAMYNMEPVAIERFDDKDVDFASQLGKIKQANPDGVVVVPLSPPTAARIVTQMKEMGLNVHVFHSTSVAASMEYVQLAKGAAEGAVGPCAFLVDNPDPKVQEFVKAFTSRYGKPPEGKEPPQAYDSVKIVALALNQKDGSGKYRFPLGFTAQSLADDRMKIRDAIATVKGYRGAIGLEVNFGPRPVPEDRDGIKTPIIARIENGKWVPVR